MRDEVRDFFLCHAGEDKVRFVNPLAAELKRRGLTVWFDKYELMIGDNLYEKISEGLRNSRWVVACLSETFIVKDWPKEELYAALNMEKETGEKRVLPVMLTDPATILGEYPLLSEKVYMESNKGVSHIAAKLEQVANARLKFVDKEVYSTEDREEMARAGYRKQENVVKTFEGVFHDSSISVDTDIEGGTRVLVEVSIVELEETAIDIGARRAVNEAIDEVMPGKRSKLLGNEEVMKALQEYAVAVGGGRKQLKEYRDRIPTEVAHDGKVTIEHVNGALDGMKAELYITVLQ